MKSALAYYSALHHSAYSDVEMFRVQEKKYAAQSVKNEVIVTVE